MAIAFGLALSISAISRWLPVPDRSAANGKWKMNDGKWKIAFP